MIPRHRYVFSKKKSKEICIACGVASTERSEAQKRLTGLAARHLAEHPRWCSRNRARTARIPASVDIFLRKDGNPGYVFAMSNSIAESFATAPTNLMTGRNARAFCNQSEFPRAGRKFLFQSAVTH
jgi:hypothetical protein